VPAYNIVRDSSDESVIKSFSLYNASDQVEFQSSETSDKWMNSHVTATSAKASFNINEE